MVQISEIQMYQVVGYPFFESLIQLLGDRFPQKNSRRHNGIYNIYWLLTRFKFVRLLTQVLPSNLQVQLTSALLFSKYKQFNSTLIFFIWINLKHIRKGYERRFNAT